MTSNDDAFKSSAPSIHQILGMDKFEHIVQC